MQLRGQPEIERFTQPVTLPRPDGRDWTFRLQPLPLGFHRRLRERGLLPPLPPHRLIRDSAGRPLRDESGLAATSADPHDPQYRADLERYHQRIAVLAVAESLRADPDVAFEAAPPAAADPAAWAAYADALDHELEAAGFTAGDLVLLCNAVCRLSNLLGDHLQRARSIFSSAPPDHTP